MYSLPFFLFLGSKHDSPLSSSAPAKSASSSPIDHISYTALFRVKLPTWPLREDEGASISSPSRFWGLTCHKHVIKPATMDSDGYLLSLEHVLAIFLDHHPSERSPSRKSRYRMHGRMTYNQAEVCKPSVGSLLHFFHDRWQWLAAILTFSLKSLWFCFLRLWLLFALVPEMTCFKAVTNCGLVSCNL